MRYMIQLSSAIGDEGGGGGGDRKEKHRLCVCFYLIKACSMGVNEIEEERTAAGQPVRRTEECDG